MFNRLLALIFVGSMLPWGNNALNSSLTDDCNISFGCYTWPANCTTCDYIVKWRTFDDSIDFKLFYDVDPSVQAQWMAVGFSYDGFMKNDSVVMCRRAQNGSFFVTTYYIGQRRAPILLNASNLTMGISQTSAGISETVFSCSFRRIKSIASLPDTFFNLSNPFYIVMAHGPLDGFNNPTYHGVNNRIPSYRLIDFSTFSVPPTIITTIPFILVKLHGILMITAWIFLATTGIIFARYYRFLFSEKLICGINLWFVIHRPVMLTCLLTSLASLLLILAFNNWTWLNPIDFPLISYIHSIFGATTLSVASLQLFAFVRPHQDSPRRKYFNYGHRTGGITAYTLSMITVFLGVYIFFGSLNYWIIIASWYGWVFLMIICLTLCDLNLKSAVDDSNAVNEKRKGIEKFKIVLLCIHLLVTLGVFGFFVAIFARLP